MIHEKRRSRRRNWMRLRQLRPHPIHIKEDKARRKRRKEERRDNRRKDKTIQDKSDTEIRQNTRQVNKTKTKYKDEI
jgi:hypothetical protein